MECFEAISCLLVALTHYKVDHEAGFPDQELVKHVFN